MDYTKEELQGMKRADLQKLCKKFGVRANTKTEKMVEELSKYSKPKNLNNQENNLPESTSNEPVNTIQEAKNDVKEIEKKPEMKESTNPSMKRKSNDNKRKKPQAKASSKIPRLNAKPKKKNVDCKTPTMSAKSKTPKRTGPKDWAKIHQKHFDQMDSLDVYLTKKRKRAEQLGNAEKRVKRLTEEKVVKPKVIQTQNLAQAKSVPVKPVQAKPMLKSTVVTPKPNEETLNNKKRLTFNFLQAAKENQTPVGVGKRRATLNEATNKAATPFRFVSNTIPFGSPTPRKKFDLQASLSKPLPYKPYTGKLRTPPYAKNSPKVAAKKANARKSHQRDVKAVKTKSRSERRERQLKTQSRARESALSRRRGMVN